MRYELTDFEWAAIVDPRVPDAVQRPGGRLTAHNAHTNVASGGANASVATGHEGRVWVPLSGRGFSFFGSIDTPAVILRSAPLRASRRIGSRREPASFEARRRGLAPQDDGGTQS